MLGLFGWRKLFRSNSAADDKDATVDEDGLLAAKEDSMVDSWAVRDMSIWAWGVNFLYRPIDRFSACRQIYVWHTVLEPQSHVEHLHGIYILSYAAREHALVEALMTLLVFLQHHLCIYHRCWTKDRLKGIYLLDREVVGLANWDLALPIIKLVFLRIIRKETDWPLSSPSSSHKHSHLPKSSGIPHSASTIIGNGVSFASALRYSGRA